MNTTRREHPSASGIARSPAFLCPLIAVALLIPPAARDARAADERDIFGWIEWVLVGERKLQLPAKLDTGAETSSLHAEDIRVYRSASGRQFVEFRLEDDDSGRTITFRKRLVREARIKQHDGGFQIRPVVMMDLCLGDHLQEVEVTLADRSEFLYPVLLGRSTLAGRVVVDPDTTYTNGPACAYGREHP